MLAEIEDFDEWLTNKLQQILQEAQVRMHMYMNLDIYMINQLPLFPFEPIYALLVEDTHLAN